MAQIGNPAGLAPDTRMEKPGVPAPNQTNYQDRLFAQLVTAGGRAEVELGRLAAEKTSHDGVSAFANRMVEDHDEANKQLKSVADKSEIPLPEELDPDHKKIRADLEKQDGVAFDLAYLAAQILDHQKTAQLLAWEIGSGEDPELQHFASDNLPKVLEHLDMARTLHAELAGQALLAAEAQKSK
ncbi:membrane protein [Mesorhizobium sp. LSHC420B00]|nr:membrane protein [Mesorhizobium sp. LSHC420B00]